jgi:signal transduction histidine kinase
LGIAARNLDQLAALIDSLRVFSEAEQGTLEVSLERVSVKRLFDECAEDYPEARTNRKLKTECPPGLHIQVDQTLFKQVITNLVANALKFSPRGSLVTLSAMDQANGVLIVVRDEGPGVPWLEKERIFEKSVRLDHGASGLGLGLYVARAIVKAHRGQVRASSGEGRGATFEVSIPA